MHDALRRVAAEIPTMDLLFLSLGASSGTADGDKRIGSVRFEFIPFQGDPRVVASYYQAADLYVHAAKVDTFPGVVLEAMACGLPVVATAAGGIPEQVVDGAEGFITPLADGSGMADALVELLRNDGKRRAFGNHAAARARAEFGVDRMIEAYLGWYEEVLDRHRPARRAR